MGSISNCGSDEHKAYSGGAAGDQTGEEWHLVPWYSRPWDCILRHPNTKVRSTISGLATLAANNDNIGYDQGQRNTYWDQLKANNYDPSKITVKCEADCSSGVCANVRAAGYLLNISELKGVPITSTHYMRDEFKKVGFEVLTSSDYTNSSAKLLAGDILLNDAHHVATWVSDDVGTSSSTSGTTGAVAQASLGIGSYKYENYTVKSGDTLASIAKKYGCTPAMIIFVNNLESTELKPGTKLKIPTTEGTLENPAKGTKPITKKHTSGILVHHPVIEAQFYTEQGLLATVSTTGLTQATDFDNDLISVNTVRDMSQDCPTFSLSLVGRHSWYQNLSSNDLVVISMQRPPEAKKVVFIGLIDDIRKSTDYSAGPPQRSVQVTGRGLNKALVNFDVGLLENISIDTNTGFFENLTNLATLNSYDAIDLVLTDYIGKAVRYKFSDGSNYEDHYQYTGNVHEGELLTDYQSYTQYNGSLWNFLKELSNIPFNETYWEIKDSKATLFHRRTPFNKEDWIDLTRQTIQDLDIVSDNTGRSDLETYTVYAVNPILGTETLTNVYMPLWYPPFVYKYGITQLSATTAYQNWGDSSGSSEGTGNDVGSGTAGSGDTVTVPDTVKQTGIIGDCTYIEQPSSSGSWIGEQKKVYDAWVEAGKKYSNGIATLNGRYLIAMRPQFGSVGDMVDVVLEDGTVINCILMDTKGSDAGEWGHKFDSAGYSLVEFEAKKGFKTADVPSNWRNKKVSKVVNSGSYTSSSSSSKAASRTTTSNTTSDGVFTKYALTDDQLTKIARLCKQEQGSVIGAAAEASLMCNRFELYGSKYGTGASGLYNYIRTAKWWANAATHMDSGSVTAQIKAAVRSVIVAGRRTMPAYIDEHDYIGDIARISTGSLSKKSDWKKYETVVYQKSSVGGGTWKFYDFPTTDSDPFGYTSEENRKKFGEVHYSATSDILVNPSSTGTGTGTVDSSSDANAGDTEAIRRFYEELFNFNIKNNIFTNGSLTVKGRASYRVGERVIMESENVEYYVESVSHSFNCYGSWTTQLGVTRGIAPEERFTPPWGSAEELDAATFNKIIKLTAGEDADWTTGLEEVTDD